MLFVIDQDRLMLKCLDNTTNGVAKKNLIIGGVYLILNIYKDKSYTICSEAGIIEFVDGDNIMTESEYRNNIINEILM